MDKERPFVSTTGLSSYLPGWNKTTKNKNVSVINPLSFLYFKNIS
jgi:hypothetical protein